MKKHATIMLYVNDVRSLTDFWVKNLGFMKISEEQILDTLSTEFIFQEGDTFTIKFFELEMIKQYSPDVSLETPSIMFYRKDFDAYRKMLKNNGVTVGEIMNTAAGRNFNFCDDQNHYFAVSEI